MYKSRMRSVAMMMAVALTASVSVSAATASTTVDRAKPSELTFAQPATFTASTQAHAVASAPASTMNSGCEPAAIARAAGTSIRINTTGPLPPPTPGLKPDLV